MLLSNGMESNLGNVVREIPYTLRVAQFGLLRLNLLHICLDD